MVPLLFIGSALLMALTLIFTAHMIDKKSDYPELIAAIIIFATFTSISLAAYSGERFAAERAARAEAIEKVLTASLKEGGNEKK